MITFADTHHESALRPFHGDRLFLALADGDACPVLLVCLSSEEFDEFVLSARGDFPAGEAGERAPRDAVDGTFVSGDWWRFGNENVVVDSENCEEAVS